MTRPGEHDSDSDQNRHETAPRPTPPSQLRAPGKALWADVAGAYSLRPDERRVLVDACRLVDVIASLERAMRGQPLTVKGSMGQAVLNPLLGEQRTHRLALAALLRQLRLPDDPGAHGVNQQRAAAQSRWANAHGQRPA